MSTFIEKLKNYVNWRQLALRISYDFYLIKIKYLPIPWLFLYIYFLAHFLIICHSWPSLFCLSQTVTDWRRLTTLNISIYKEIRLKSIKTENFVKKFFRRNCQRKDGKKIFFLSERRHYLMNIKPRNSESVTSKT